MEETLEERFTRYVKEAEAETEECFKNAEKAVVSELLKEFQGKDDIYDVVAKKYGITTVVFNGVQHG